MRPKFTRPALRLHIGRAFAGSLGVTCMFAAATLIPLADATAISMLNPIIAMVLAIPLLGESVGPRRWAAAALSVIGALLLIRPGAESFQPAALIALLAAVVLACELSSQNCLAAVKGRCKSCYFRTVLALFLLALRPCLYGFGQPRCNGSGWLASAC